MNGRFAEGMLPEWPWPLACRLDIIFARYQLAQETPAFVVESWKRSVEDFVAERNACIEGVASVDMAFLEDSSDSESDGISVHQV